MSVTRIKRTSVTPNVTIPANGLNSVTWKPGTPPQEALWLIETVTLSLGFPLGSEPTDPPAAGSLPNYMFMAIQDTDPSTPDTVVALAERFMVGASLPIRAPIPAEYQDTPIITAIATNDTVNPIQVSFGFYFQALQVSLDDPIGRGFLIPEDTTTMTRV